MQNANAVFEKLLEERKSTNGDSNGHGAHSNGNGVHSNGNGVHSNGNGTPHRKSKSKAIVKLVDQRTAEARRLPTGIERLDDLLDGGIPQGTATLLYGPPFTGKGILQNRFFVEGLKSGEHSALVLTDSSASDISRVLHTYDADFSQNEKVGSYIDLYTRTIGERESHAHTTYLQDPQDWSRVLEAIERVEKKHLKNGRSHSRLVIQSISTLMVEIGSVPTYRFLRQLLGRFCRRGGTVLLAMESGMHEPHEVETVKHLCSGMISMRENNDTHYLRVEGLPTAFQPGWIEYRFNQNEFDVVGSFASGRIRGSAVQ